ncbi:MAG: hypothetical protein HY646_18055 [Acidobacteria bacterium]|nr:hypothetical protein [Acidobacteriota bacterium]
MVIWIRREVLAQRSRSAKTGRFVTRSYANKHPSTTVTETCKTTNPKQQKKENDETIERGEVMNQIRYFFAMLGRLVVFARTYPHLFAKDTPAGNAMAEVETAYQRYVSLAAAVAGGDVAVRKSTDDRVKVRGELRSFMDTISRIAKGLGLPQFALPKERAEATLVSIGRMWSESDALQAKFSEGGFPATWRA